MIGKGITAYWNMVNDQGGINGRKVNFITYDDGFQPPKTVEMVRKLVEVSGLGWDAPCPFGQGTLGAALLAPTRLYVRPALAAIRAGGIHALAHITGGGLTENLPRVLPDGLGARIDLTSWALPPVFRWLAGQGGFSQTELLKTFNAGIGMVAVAAPDRAKALAALLASEGETVHTLGEVIGGEGVSYSGQIL